ncbi:hypothetical protein GGI21_002250 [Coemansia aciculifera]|nr:hypothetical protein GGI21_002250 [Coemansia aciculifera]
MDDSPRRTAATIDDVRFSELVEQPANTGPANDDTHNNSSSSSNPVGDTIEPAEDSDTVSDEEDEEGGDEDDVSIFVAEEAYAPLVDDDDTDSVTPALPASIDDAFQCHSTTTANAIPFDIEQELDSRIEAELAAKQTLEASSTFSKRHSLAAPIEVAVGRGDKMSDEHIGQIKSIMAGIHLSDAAIPEWSRRVPEGTWMPRRRTVSSAQRPTSIPDQPTR